MSEVVNNWKYAEELALEPDSVASARAHAIELGLEPISAGVGAQIAVIAAASGAKNIVEFGTGTGHAALWLLRGSPEATITSVDGEVEHHSVARDVFTEAGVPAKRTRLISGRFVDVLPRLNEASYDLVLINTIERSVIELVEHGLRLAKPGGVVLLTNVFNDGNVPNPAKRDDTSQEIRTLLTELFASTAVSAAVSPSGDGLLQIVKHR